MDKDKAVEKGMEYLENRTNVVFVTSCEMNREATEKALQITAKAKEEEILSMRYPISEALCKERDNQISKLKEELKENQQISDRISDLILERDELKKEMKNTVVKMGLILCIPDEQEMFKQFEELIQKLKEMK